MHEISEASIQKGRYLKCVEASGRSQYIIESIRMSLIISLIINMVHWLSKAVSCLHLCLFSIDHLHHLLCRGSVQVYTGYFCVCLNLNCSIITSFTLFEMLLLSEEKLLLHVPLSHWYWSPFKHLMITSACTFISAIVSLKASDFFLILYNTISLQSLMLRRC